MPHNTEIILLRARLEELHRVTRYENFHLKNRFPKIYAEIKRASEENDKRYLAKYLEKLATRFPARGKH
jgi:uncharacterized protein (DUF952 family)